MKKYGIPLLLYILLFQTGHSMAQLPEEKRTQFVGVGAIFIQDANVLLLYRNNTSRCNNLYGLVGGLVEPHESIRHAVIREIYEEVGVEVAPEDVELVHVISGYDLECEMVGFYFFGKKMAG